MSIITIGVELPADLARGILGGLLKREGGVVRRVADGTIVAHLREAGLPAMTSATALSMGVALVQVAGLVFIEHHLRRIESRIVQLSEAAQLTLERVGRVERRQWTSVGDRFAAALEFLRQSAASGGASDLERARGYLIECRAAIRHQVQETTVDEFLAIGLDTEWLLRLDLDCAAAELHVYNRLGGNPRGESRTSLQSHRETFDLFGRRLDDLPSPRRRLPSREMVNASPEGNPYRTAARWRTETAGVVDALDREIEVQDLLAEVPAEGLALAQEESARLERPLIVIRPS